MIPSEISDILKRANYTRTGDGAKVDAWLEQLRTQPAWEPVAKAHCACGDPSCNKYVRVEYGDDHNTLWYTMPNGRECMMYLPSDVGLHRLVQQQPQGDSHE